MTFVCIKAVINWISTFKGITSYAGYHWIDTSVKFFAETLMKEHSKAINTSIANKIIF